MGRGQSPELRGRDMFSPSGPTLTFGGRWFRMIELLYVGVNGRCDRLFTELPTGVCDGAWVVYGECLVSDGLG